MAGPIGNGLSSGRQRVFVLVDKGHAKGVFTSWEAAETFADEHRLSLDHLMEYVTRSDHPDHLHLLAAKWEGDWEFQGEWTKQAPNWPDSPQKIRLDHYHAKGGGFQLLRQKEFDWEKGLLWKINPMAPDEALKADVPVSSPQPTEQPPQWKPKLTPLKPVQPTPSKPRDRSQEDRPPPPGTPPSKSLVSEPEPPIDEPAGEKPEKADFPKPSPPEKPKLATAANAGQSSATNEESKPAAEEDPEKPAAQSPEPRITFQKKSPLRLKSKAAPAPIPSFKPTAPPLDMAGRAPSSVEVAQKQFEAMKKAEEEKRKAEMPVRRVWSIRLILSVVLVIACWAGGIFWVLRPEPTVAKILVGVNSLNPARVKIMEPEMAFFQLPVDPAHQERWIQSVNLKPLQDGRIIRIPTFHALDTWEKQTGFVRPPYSLTEVEEWWDLRLRNVQYGFTYEWEDGTMLILDLESDSLIGWAHAKRLPELLN